jgi:hypothetical protein
LGVVINNLSKGKTNMAESKSNKGGVGQIAPGEKFEGHGDNTQPAGIQSPATFAPLATEPTAVNQKSESGRKGKVE